MQRNDLVVFEFANPASGMEVLLNPYVVSELRDFLNSTTQAWTDLYNPDASFELLLAAVDHGSIKIAFLVRFMEHANTAIDFAQKVGSALMYAGVLSGALVLAPPASSEQDPNVASPALVEKCSDAFHKLIRTAAKSGVEEVTVSFPGCGTAIITSDNSKDVQLIGAWATPLEEGPANSKPYQGKLKNIDGPFDLQRKNDNHHVRVYVGDIEMPNGQLAKVVLHWGSKRPIEQAISSESVSITGTLTGNVNGFLMQGDLISDLAIDPALRRVRGYLYVDSQIVAE